MWILQANAPVRLPLHSGWQGKRGQGIRKDQRRILLISKNNILTKGESWSMELEQKDMPAPATSQRHRVRSWGASVKSPGNRGKISACENLKTTGEIVVNLPNLRCACPFPSLPRR